MKGSDAALKYLEAAQNTRLKKVEGDIFLPVDTRPNGRPSPPPSSEEREKGSSVSDANFLNSMAVGPG